MKPTLDEMCKFLARQLVFATDAKEIEMLEAIYERMAKEQQRRKNANRKRQVDNG
jgi:L-2-hydroxyglutarate oxidase LhgO